jgi:hypothetical protein
MVVVDNLLDDGQTNTGSRVATAAAVQALKRAKYAFAI